MSIDSGFKIIVGDTTLVDLTNVTATAEDVKEGKIFGDKNGQCVEGTYKFSAQEKTVSPLTIQQEVTPDPEKYLSKVTVNAIPTQEKTVEYNTETVQPDTGYFLSKVNINQPTTEEIEVTPSTLKQIITPSSNKDYISKVTVNAISTQQKTITPTNIIQEVTPDPEKYLSKVTVNAIPTQEKTVTPTTLEQEVIPDTGKYLSKVVIGGIGAELDKLNKLIGGGF